MRIQFRQGIVRAPANFIQLTTNTVSINLAGDSIIATVADGTSNYLITERVSVPDAWAGPFSAGATSYWLYWDIDLITGATSYGHTILAPIESPTAPVAPANDQHWFDTVNFKMKVWNATATRWIPKVRVFAAKLDGGTVLESVSDSSPAFTGTQIGDATTVSAGSLVFDADTVVVKRGNGTFLTTEDVVLTGIGASSRVKLGSIVIEAEVVGSVATHTVVRFSAFDKVTSATNATAVADTMGLVESAGSAGQIINVVMSGLVTYEGWDWTTAGVNASLYVGAGGSLSTTPGANPVVFAKVVGKKTIRIL